MAKADLPRRKRRQQPSELERISIEIAAASFLCLCRRYFLRGELQMKSVFAEIAAQEEGWVLSLGLSEGDKPSGNKAFAAATERRSS